MFTYLIMNINDCFDFLQWMEKINFKILYLILLQVVFKLYTTTKYNHIECYLGWLVRQKQQQSNDNISNDIYFVQVV